MIYVVAGVGPNNLEIPLIVFEDRESAEKFVEKFPKDPKNKGFLDGDFSEKDGIYYDEDDDEGLSKVGKPLYEALFKGGNYYSGCGGCYSLRILEVEFGKPMVAWDMD